MISVTLFRPDDMDGRPGKKIFLIVDGKKDSEHDDELSARLRAHALGYTAWDTTAVRGSTDGEMMRNDWMREEEKKNEPAPIHNRTVPTRVIVLQGDWRSSS